AAKRAPAIAAKSATAYGTNEGARSIDRERRNIIVEILPTTIDVAVTLKQILLDIRQVERRNDRAMTLYVLPNASNRLRAAEIAGQRHDQILHFQLTHELIVCFAGKIASLFAIQVAGSHQRC